MFSLLFFSRYGRYFIKHCFICSPSNSIVLEDAGIDAMIDARIEPSTVVLALSVRRSNHLARSHPLKLYLQLLLD